MVQAAPQFFRGLPALGRLGYTEVSWRYLHQKMAGGLERTRTSLPTEGNSAVFTVSLQATE